MSYKIDEIEGIGPTYREKLSAAKIKTTDDLLDQCGTPTGRKQVAELTGCGDKQLLEWANMADLMRIKGVGPEYAELLEASGVDTVKELKNRRPRSLATTMAELNQDKKLTRQVPSQAVVAGWIEQSQSLDPCISH